jgi:predicted GNAT family acetyltransferase
MAKREESNVKIENNQEAQRWEAEVGEYVAVAEYRLRGDMVFFIHTEVPHELEGQGVASKLVKAALDDARTRHLAVVPFCPFVAGYIRRHPDYKGLVHAEYRDLVEGELD